MNKIDDIQTQIQDFENAYNKTDYNKKSHTTHNHLHYAWGMVLDIISPIVGIYCLYRYIFDISQPFHRLDFIILLIITSMSGLYYNLKKQFLSSLKNENRSNASI